MKVERLHSELQPESGHQVAHRIDGKEAASFDLLGAIDPDEEEDESDIPQGFVEEGEEEEEEEEEDLSK